MKIYGNKIGGNSAYDKTYIVDDNGIQALAVVVDDTANYELSALSKDVRAGKVFIGANGLDVGTNDTPCCRVTNGVHEVYPGVEFMLCFKEADQWDYSTVHAVITNKSTPFKVENLIVHNKVYDPGGKEIAEVTKDAANNCIRFNIKNETAEVQLLHFFVCKEEM